MFYLVIIMTLIDNKGFFMIQVGDAVNALLCLSLVPPAVGVGVGYAASQSIHMPDKRQEKVTRTAITAFGGFVGIFSGFLVIVGGLLALPIHGQKV